jgi:muconolactone delta-isomerase
MLFYVQMRWNYQGRITMDELWEREKLEGQHAQQTVDNGMVKGIWKVAAQDRVIVIVDVASAEDLDRSVYTLPMREYLQYEAVWALRDYNGFLADVDKHYGV